MGRPGRALCYAVSAVLALGACATRAQNADRTDATPSTPSVTVGTPRQHASSTGVEPSPSTSTPAPRSTAPPPEQVRAAAHIQRLTSSLGRGGVSIDAVRLDGTGTFAYGANGGMACGSIAKLYILETLLLQHQRNGDWLDDDEQESAEDMITESDNDAADDLYERIDAAAAFRNNLRTFGLRDTVPGNDLYWGFTTTSARDFVALLRALVSTRALNKRSRRYALDLLSRVDPDQHWGVSAADDDPDDALVKNGWLSSSRDDDRWLVNSVGIITVHGKRMLLAVLTQHGADFDDGVELVEQLARISSRAVA